MEAQNKKPEQDKEERSYREEDLFYKQRGLAVSVAGFALVILGLIINILQSEKVAKSIRVNVENSIVTHVTSLDQVFITDPDLTPYFYANKPINEDDPKYPKASATAVMTLDVFDEVAGQNRHYPEFWDTPEAWDEWVIGVFSTSPILRDTFDKYPCWYGKRLWELRHAQIKSGGDATATRPCINPEVSRTWPLAVLWFLGGLLSAFLPPGQYRLPLVWMPYLSPGGVRPQAKARSFMVPGIIGAIGGLVGGWLFFRAWIAGERVSWPESAATLVGSYVFVQILVMIIYWLIETWRAKHHTRVSPEGDGG